MSAWEKPRVIRSVSAISSDRARRKILCKRISTKSRISHYQCACWWLIPPVHISPSRLGRYARRGRCECRPNLPGILLQGNQPAFRSANMISNWLRTMSQFWQRACQCLTIRWDARYSIRRRESSFVKECLFFVICRNCRFRPPMMFVVYMIFRISGGYSKKVFRTSQLSSQLLTQEGYCFRHSSPNARRFSSASCRVTAV